VKRCSSKRDKEAKILVVGIIVGFIAMAFLSFIPILGPILAGFIGGVIAGGRADWLSMRQN